MKKNKINREMLKKNILKRVIIKFDYQGIVDIEKILINLGPFLAKKFSEYEKKYINSIDLTLPNPEELSKSLNIPIEKIIKEEVNSYYQNKEWDDRVILNITKFTTELQIFCKNYKTIDSYINFMRNLIDFYKVEEPFFRIKKLSIRKISWAFFRKYDEIFEVFEKDIFPKRINGYKILNSNINEKYELDDYSINYNKIIEEGIAFNEETKKEDTVYRVALDFEAYKENINDDDEILIKMNLELFNFFKESVTNEFLNQNMGEK